MAQPIITPSREQRMAELQVTRRRAELAGDTELVERCESMMARLRRPSQPGIKMRHGARPGEVEVYENGRWVAQVP